MALAAGHYRSGRWRRKPEQAGQGRGWRPGSGGIAPAAPAAYCSGGLAAAAGEGGATAGAGALGRREGEDLLTGTGEVLDSAEVTRHDFELETTPAVCWEGCYGIVAVAGRDTLEREEVPV